MNYQKDLPDLPSQDGRTIDAMSWGEICTIAMHYQAGKLLAQEVDIIEELEAQGVDHARLKAALDTKDNWGALVHSFEYLTVLGVVEIAMRKEAAG